MALRTDDPVYYKVALTRLVEKAKTNGLKVFEKDGRVAFRADCKDPNFPDFFEQASVNVNEVFNKE